MDLTRIIENICNELGYNYVYGNKSHINLIDQNGALEPDKFHLLLFPINTGNKNNNDSSRTCNGNFFFVMPDEFAQSYKDKFETKIEPCKITLAILEDRISYCENIDIIQFTSIDAVDILDANLTGLWVTFQFKVYE